MPTIALRESTWNAATAKQRAIMRIALEMLEFGQPARYQTSGAVVWFVFDDHRTTLRDCAILGRLAATLAAMPGTVNTRADLWNYIKGTIVLPGAISYTNGGNPYAETLAANSAPVWLQADSRVPATLTPVGE